MKRFLVFLILAGCAPEAKVPVVEPSTKAADVAPSPTPSVVASPSPEPSPSETPKSENDKAYNESLDARRDLSKIEHLNNVYNEMGWDVSPERAREMAAKAAEAQEIIDRTASDSEKSDVDYIQEEDATPPKTEKEKLEQDLKYMN